MIISFRRQENGHLLRLQVHRDLGWHQSQRGRIAGWFAHADSPEAGKPGAHEGPVSQEVPQEPQQIATGLVLGEQLAKEVPGQPNKHKPQGAQLARQSVGKGQQVQELREPSCPVSKHAATNENSTMKIEKTAPKREEFF